MENDPKIINCHVCGGLNNKFYCRKNNFDLYKCSNCGHIFIFPFSFDVANLYGEDYFAGAENGSGYVDYDKDKEPMRPVFVEYMKRIEKVSNKKGRLLDIGAATGFFLEIANKLGWDGQGLEISKYATGVAVSKGLKVDCGTFDEVSFEGQSFDCVTMWDVLEHLPDPRGDLDKIHSVLKKDAVLAINTPDSGSLFARVMGKRWHLLVPPEHINYFTNKSVRVLLERGGFEVKEISRIGKTFTLEYVFSILASWLKVGILHRVVSFLKKHHRIGSIPIPINLYDNMFIIAKRVEKQ